MNITQLIKLIYESKHPNKYEHFSLQYPNEFEQYPKLCKHACDSNFDFHRFTCLMNIKEQIETSAISQYDADVQVGTILANAYIKKNHTI